MQGTKILKVPALWDVTLCQVPKYCLTLKQKVLRFFECASQSKCLYVLNLLPSCFSCVASFLQTANK